MKLKKQIQTNLEFAWYQLQGKPIIHFLHIRKAAGSVIRESLIEHLLSQEYKFCYHSHKFTLRNVPKGHKVFFTLRDPVSRFVSGFYCRKREGKPRYNSLWTLEEKIAFNQFSTANELALALSSDNNNLREAAQNAMNNIQHLRYHYDYWLGGKDYFLSRLSDILFIGFQETLDRDFLVLKKILRLPEDVQLPQDNIKAHRNPSEVNRFLDDVAKRNLEIWYADDYDFLKLCQEKAPKINDSSLQSF